MIRIENDLAIIEFKKGPFTNDAKNCVGLVMEMLNLSKSFSSILKKGKKPGKKMEKTGRIRIGIEKFVNKTGVDPSTVDKLIHTIRTGNLKVAKVQVGEKEIELYPNNDVPEVIANLILKK